MTPETPESSITYQSPTHDYLRQRLQQMDPEAFEVFVSDVWEYLGWQTRVVGKPPSPWERRDWVGDPA